LSFVLARLLEPLSTALERAGRAAAAIRLQLRLVDRTTHERVLQLPAAIRDARVLRTLLLLDLESHAPPEAVDVVTIEVDPAPGRVLQYSLLERALPSAETLATLMARLGALVGESRCGSPRIPDTHRPDAFEMERFNPSSSPSRFAEFPPFALRAMGGKPSSRAPELPSRDMKVFTDYLWFNTKQRQEFIRITDDVAAIVGKSGVQEGMVLVSAMHITAAVYVNDWEDGLIADFQEWLEKLAPSGLPYRHHQTGEDNADAHLKRTLMGHQVIVPITAEKLDLGPWEQVFYAEFDGRRRKRVVVKVMGA
jgi:secondary thiamine-phosphate synthase enzyme